MTKDFRCALPSRAGRTILVGCQTIQVGTDGIARGVDGDAAALFTRLPAVWSCIDEDGCSEAASNNADRLDDGLLEDDAKPVKPRKRRRRRSWKTSVDGVEVQG